MMAILMMFGPTSPVYDVGYSIGYVVGTFIALWISFGFFLLAATAMVLVFVRCVKAIKSAVSGPTGHSEMTTQMPLTTGIHSEYTDR